MRCPFCGNNDTQVKDSRPSDDERVIRRRRECQGCNKRFTTFERFQIQQVVVVKRDGRHEMFEGEKIMKCLMTALRKRPVNRAQLTNIVTELEQNFGESGRTEITSREIGDAVLDKLKEVDFIGYVRYASVYNEFKGPDDFQGLLDHFHKD